MGMWARMQTMPADISKRHCGGEGQRVLGVEGRHFCPLSSSNRPPGQTVVMMQGVPAVGATEGVGESPGAIPNPPPGQTVVMMQVAPGGGAREGAGESAGASIPVVMTANPSTPISPPGQPVVVQLVPVLVPNMPLVDQKHARQILEDAMPQVYED